MTQTVLEKKLKKGGQFDAATVTQEALAGQAQPRDQQRLLGLHHGDFLLGRRQPCQQAWSRVLV